MGAERRGDDGRALYIPAVVGLGVVVAAGPEKMQICIFNF